MYEYRCLSCSELTDIRHGFDDVNTEKCPKCGGELTRNFSAAAIAFKGSGFYVNDSRSASSSTSSAGSSASSNTAAPSTPAAPAAPAPAASGDSGGSASTGSATPPAPQNKAA